MKSKEVARLMLAIRDHGHHMAYLPETKAELEARGLRGFAEEVMGLVPVIPQDKDTDETSAYVCTVIVPGEMLSMPDNKTGPCAWGCGRTVQFRPWAPPDLPRVCLYCMAERRKDDN